jgi:hypothetical protein
MDAYRELGGKINRFIQFVGKEWNKDLKQEKIPRGK